MKRSGETSAGRQRWRCSSCAASLTIRRTATAPRSAPPRTLPHASNQRSSVGRSRNSLARYPRRETDPSRARRTPYGSGRVARAHNRTAPNIARSRHLSTFSATMRRLPAAAPASPPCACPHRLLMALAHPDAVVAPLNVDPCRMRPPYAQNFIRILTSPCPVQLAHRPSLANNGRRRMADSEAVDPVP